MRTIGNILWHFPFFGFVSAFFVYLLGLLLVATVIAAPVGLGLMELGKFLLFPFGHEMVSKSALEIEQNSAWKAYSSIIMILYIPFGLFLAIGAIIQVAFLFFCIFGIPVALVIAKSLGTYFNPVGKICVSSAVSAELDRRKGQADVEKYLGKPANNEIQSNPISAAKTEIVLSQNSNEVSEQYHDRYQAKSSPTTQVNVPETKKILTIFAIISVVGILFASYSYVQKKQRDLQSLPEFEAKIEEERKVEHLAAQKRSKANTIKQTKKTIQIAPITANLISSSVDRYLQASFSVETNSEDSIRFQSNMAQVRSRILQLLSTKTVTELLTPDGKDQMISQLTNELKSPLENDGHEQKISKILVTNFIIQ